MCDRERLSATIGDIYATCLDPSRWMDVIGKAARFVGGSAASLYSQDPCSRTGSHSVSYGIEPRYQQLYLDKYVQLDPAANGQIVARVEEPVAMADLMPYDEFVATRFYREWARPQGLVDFVASVLDKTMTSAAVFRVFRHERDGAVDDEMRQRMALVIPHLRRAMLIGNAIELKRAEAATFADALDGLGAGVFLVDADGGLVHANAAGHAILAADDFLRAIGGRRPAGPQGGTGNPLGARRHRQGLSSDPDRAARAHGDRRGRRRSRGRGRARHRRDHGQDASEPRFSEDRRHPSGRSRQAGGRFCEPGGTVTPHGTVGAFRGPGATRQADPIRLVARSAGLVRHAAAVRLRATRKPPVPPRYPPLPGGRPGGRALAISNEDMMRHWIVVTQQSPNELARCHSQGVGPNQVTLGRQPTSTAFDLRHERILGSHLSRQFALGQTSLIPELAKPAARRGAQLHRQRV